MERKLTAILSADVKGYSRMMGQNEVTTIQTLTSYREIMAALIQQHRGRVVDSPGDNLLAEFASVVDAVQGAVAIQHELKARNADLPPGQKMEFRIGINLGDVVVEGGRIYGDGVNIAARVESLAEAGGICLSGTVHEHIKNKLPLGYESLGKREVKNIADPIHVYRVLMEGEETSLQAQESEPAAEPAGRPSSPPSGQARVPISFSAAQSLIGGGVIGGIVVLVNFFVPLNTDGLRSDFIPTAGLEVSF